MPFRITVTKIESAPAQLADHPTLSNLETEVYRQTVDTLDLTTIVLALNKRTRVRKSKSA